MGSAIPQVITPSKASGAQVIDGSLKFEDNFLTRTPSSQGNLKSWTWSAWVKPDRVSGNLQQLFEAKSGGTDYDAIYFTSGQALQYDLYRSSQQALKITNRVFRDTGWYHIVVVYDAANSTADDRVRIYVNGERETSFSSSTNPDTTDNSFINDNGIVHQIGDGQSSNQEYDGRLSQVYLIDGQALDASYFGFTDPLTNTWRPKKYEGTFGTNGFYLPMDGNSPIGHDKSNPSPINDGTVWSSFITGTEYGNSYKKTNMFDGVATSGTRTIPSSNTSMTWTPPSPIPINSTLRLYCYCYNDVDAGLKINGTNYGSAVHAANGTSMDWYVVPGPPATLTSLEWSTGNAGAEQGAFSAVEVDGVVLIDNMYGNGWTPVNFGGSNSLEKATGALPILNTTQGGTQAGVGVRTDANHANLFLAVPLVGNDKDVSHLVNSASTEKVATNSSVAAATTRSNFYSGSHYWSANSDTLQYAQQGDELVFGTGDFTIECWLFDDNGHNGGGSGRCYIFDNRIGGSVTGDPPQILAYVDGHSEWNVYIGNPVVEIVVDVGTAAIVDQWNHFAVTRDGSTVRMFVNGVQLGSAASSTDFTNNGIGVGRATDSGYGWSGYIQDFRVYKGVAKYTSNFIPASTNPDVLPDTPSGVSGSSKLTKITEGAVSFDGSGDQLEVVGPGTLAASSNWCAECYAYCTGASDGTFRIISAKESVNGSEYWMIRYRLGKIVFHSGNNYDNNTSNVMNRWVHLAMTKSGNTVRGFVDGKEVWENTSDNSSTNITTLVIGGGYGSENWPGFISNARFVNGSSVYTSDFTPPTAPLTNITNTFLLCCQSNTSASEAAVGSSTVAWLPTGYTYWTAGMSQNWAGSSGTTSNADDYINVALPTSGKYYWETTLNNIGTYRVMGISAGAAGAGSAYTNNIFGFYYNGNPPLFLTKNSSGTTRAASGVSHGASVGTPNWANGDKLMWAWDADNDKIYMGLNGTWYNSGDPAAGTGQIIDTEDLSASSFYFKLGYTADGGSLTLSNVTSGNSGSTTFPEVNGDAAATNFTPFNTDINTVRGQETGYATLNPLDTVNSPVLSNGNLDQTETTTEYGRARSTLSFDVEDSNGYYAEITATGSVASSTAFGIIPTDQKLDTGSTNGITGYKGLSGRSTGWWIVDGAVNGTTDTGLTETPGDVLALAVRNGSVDMYINGVFVGTLSGLSGQYSFITSAYNTTNALSANFGQKPFKFPPPDGFQPLNAANTRPETVIARPDQFVGAKAFAIPDDGSGGSVTLDNDFDMVWTKNTTNDSTNHVLQDSVRGYGDNKNLHPNLTTGQTSTNNITAVNGRTLTIGSNSNYYDNNVAWSWRAGGSKNTFNVDDVGYASAAAAGLNGGDISPVAASVGTKQGFSIIQYQGNGSRDQSISHGLTQAPDFSIIKNMDGTANWTVFHRSVTTTNQKVFYLNTDAAIADYSNGSYTWWHQLPGASLFYIGDTGTAINNGSNDMISYHWHDVPGLQKFGSFEGNGSADGPFVELGFKPAVVILKNVDNYGTGYDWFMFDNQRDENNPCSSVLLSNSADNASSSNSIDFLSNGFKLRATTNGINLNAHTIVYMAWAEAPTVNLFGGQSNAR